MYLLLDSSGRNLSVALANTKDVIVSSDFDAWQKQSELMIAEIARLAATINFSLKQITGIVVGIGPGSFTGVRISVTIAKVLGFALSIPVYAAPSLSFFADALRPTICVSDARSMRSYVCIMQGKEIILQPQIMTNDELVSYIKAHKNHAIAGELKHLNIESQPFNRFANMLKCIADAYEVKDIKKLKPIYLKD